MKIDLIPPLVEIPGQEHNIVHQSTEKIVPQPAVQSIPEPMVTSTPHTTVKTLSNQSFQTAFQEAIPGIDLVLKSGPQRKYQSKSKIPPITDIARQDLIPKRGKPRKQFTLQSIRKNARQAKKVRSQGAEQYVVQEPINDVPEQQVQTFSKRSINILKRTSPKIIKIVPQVVTEYVSQVEQTNPQTVQNVSQGSTSILPQSAGQQLVKRVPRKTKIVPRPVPENVYQNDPETEQIAQVQSTGKDDLENTIYYIDQTAEATAYDAKAAERSKYNKEFNDAWDLQFENPKKKDWSCNICNQVFQKQNELTVHKKVSHRPVCEICGTVFFMQSSLKTHKRVHYGTTPHKCNLCGIGFHTSSCLVTHNSIYHLTKFECKICKKVYANQGVYKKHMKTHHLNCVSRQYKCEICLQIFADQTCLDEHVKDHNKYHKHICEICGRVFKKRKNLRTHIYSHLNEKNTECEKCDIRFATRRLWNVHMKRKHSLGKIHKCEVCQKDFGEKIGLVIHMRHHTGEKPYQCYICDAKFISKPVLKKHIRRHANRKK